jgi:hypothetical protein
MQFQNLINAVALVLFIAGAHAKVQAGSIYSIVNKVKSSEGEDRAITFNGEDKTVTVSLDDPTASNQVYSASINHSVYIFLTHPSAVDFYKRSVGPEKPQHFSCR